MPISRNRDSQKDHRKRVKSRNYRLKCKYNEFINKRREAIEAMVKTYQDQEEMDKENNMEV